jgi:NADH-quinone oxidoreductase subunit N
MNKMLYIPSKFITYFFFVPEVILAISCLFLLLLIAIANFKGITVSASKRKFISVYFIKTAISICVVILILYIWLFVNVSSAVHLNIEQQISFDFYNLVFKILVVSTGILILMASIPYVADHEQDCIEFSFLILISLFFLICLIMSSSLIFMFMSIIGFSMNVYILVMYDAPSHISVEASVKYFYLSALSSGLLASGIVLMYMCTLNLDFIYVMAYLDYIKPEIYTLEDYGLVSIAIYSTIFGFLFKLAAFPCQLWAPEVYEGSPNPVMGFFILPIKIATFAIFIKLLANVFIGAYEL